MKAYELIINETKQDIENLLSAIREGLEQIEKVTREEAYGGKYFSTLIDIRIILSDCLKDISKGEKQ
jgi:hypothetical protein